MRLKRYNDMGERREEVRLINICQGNYFDDLIGYTPVEEKQLYFDGEKGFVDYECVMRRDRDGKFFKFEYTNFGMGNTNIKEQIAYEVERKQKIVYYYE